MIATLRPLTYEDLLDMPDDGQRYEIIGGELIVTPAPAINHQRVLRSLIKIFSTFINQTGRGELMLPPIEVVLERYSIVQPDLVLVETNNVQVPQDPNRFEGPPDLVVEVSSPISSRIDLVRKSALYARAGIREYWIANPERQRLAIEILQDKVYVPAEPDAAGRLTSRVFPDLRVDPVEVFAGLD